MPITAASKVRRKLADGETVTLSVTSDITDPEQLIAAARAAYPRIAAFGGYVTQPAAIPGGFMFTIDPSKADPAGWGAIVAVITTGLRSAGIEFATISEAATIGTRYDALDSFTPVAQAWLGGSADRAVGFRQPPRLDARLVDIAAEWLRTQQRGGMEIIVQAISAEIPVTWETLGPVVRGALASGISLVTGGIHSAPMIVTDFATAVARAEPGALLGTGLTLTAAGANWDVSEVAAHMRNQRDSVRSHLGELAWAAVTAEADGRRYLWGTEADRPSDVVPGPMWYQILSAEQAGTLGRRPASAIDLPDGRIELTIGDPEQWVPGHPDRDAMYTRARALITGTSRWKRGKPGLRAARRRGRARDSQLRSSGAAGIHRPDDATCRLPERSPGSPKSMWWRA
jgi:hypothetical protein